MSLSSSSKTSGKAEPLNAENLRQKARWSAEYHIREAKAFAARQSTLIEALYDKKWDEH